MSININLNFYFGWKWSWLSKRTVRELKGKTPSNEPFIMKAKEEIEKASCLCSRSTTENRITALNAFEKFLHERGDETTTADGLTIDHIKAFEKWQLDHGRKLNYVRCNLRNLRAIINRINGKGPELFESIRTANAQTEKRAVNAEIISKLEECQLPRGSRKDLARNIFLFCFYAMGIPLIDAVHLRKSQYRDGHIIYYRHKTHRQVKIKVAPKLKQMIDKLSHNDSPYLLPILTAKDNTEVELQYKRFQQNYNRTLARISEDLGMESHLTSYTPRHTWASIAFEKGININVISQALGHANTRTTQNYIRELSGEQLNEANLMVIQRLERKIHPDRKGMAEKPQKVKKNKKETNKSDIVG